MRIAILALGCAAFTLSGCLEVDQTDSGFKTPSASGSLSGNSKSNVNSGQDSSAVTGNTYAYQAGGIDSEGGFQAFSGIANGASVTTAPITGSATMSGRYEAARVSAIFANGDQLNGFGRVYSGVITLDVDFADGTLTGSDGDLTVEGTFSGDDLGGTATFLGVSGPLDGLVGANEAIGVFHGNSDSAVHAGGFIVN